MRIPCLIVLHTILSTFAMAFAEIVKRSENSVAPVSPCEELRTRLPSAAAAAAEK
jgi:hypothetical protein